MLVWNTFPTSSYAAADVILGQATDSGRVENMGGAVSAAGLYRPNGVAIDSLGRLYVSDTSNHRVLVWNTIPTENGKAADLVLGQTDFLSVLSNRGLAAAAADTVNSPEDIWAVGGKVYVHDRGNSRALMWSEANITNVNGIAAESHANGADVSSTLAAAPSETNYTPSSIVNYGIYRIISERFRLLLLSL